MGRYLEPTRASLSLLEMAVIALLGASAVALVVANPWMPMNDASSHLATAVIAQGLRAGDPFFAEHYAFDAVPLPYWLATLLLQPLLAVFDPLTAYSVLMALYVVAMPLALLSLYREAAPESAPLAVLGLAAAFSTAWWLGEAAFLVGQPLALWGFALFLRVRSFRSGAFWGFLVLAVAAYLAHLFAIAALVAAAGCMAVLHVARRTRLAAAQWVGLGVGVLLCLGGAWLVLFSHGTEANQGHLVFDPRLYRLAAVVTYTLDTPGSGGVAVSLALVVLMLGLLVAPLIEAGVRRRLPLEQLVNLPLLLPGLAFVVLAWLGPAGVQDTMGFEDLGQRFTVPAFLFGAGALRLLGTPRRRLAVFAVAAALTAWQVRDAWIVARAYQGPADRVRAQLLDRIPEHSRVLPLLDVTHEDGTVWRMHRFVNYVVSLRHGYSPHVFARTGQQPLRHRTMDEYRLVANLDVTEDEWRFYDYVLLQTDKPDPAVPGLSTHARLLAATDGFALYQIRHAP